MVWYGRGSCQIGGRMLNTMTVLKVIKLNAELKEAGVVVGQRFFVSKQYKDKSNYYLTATAFDGKYTIKIGSKYRIDGEDLFNYNDNSDCFTENLSNNSLPGGLGGS